MNSPKTETSRKGNGASNDHTGVTYTAGITGVLCIILLFAMFLLVSGCTDSTSIEAVTLTTDNDTYRSGEEMVITVGITASGDVDTALVNISGIRNTFERNMLANSRTVHLTQGDNSVEFKFETPSCSECSGVPPGNHTITAVVTVGGSLYNATTVVILEADEEEGTGGGESDGADNSKTDGADNNESQVVP